MESKQEWMECEKALDVGALRDITPFSGTPEEMAGGERMISEGKALQKVQTAYTTAVAVQKPRSIAKITANVLAEAKLAGAAFFYRWEVKNKKTGRKSLVQGASIDLAMCIARNYGNCAIDIDGTENATHYMLKGIFIDLETGFTVPRLYRQRKRQDIGGGYGDDRSEDIVFQIAQSKAQRNAIVKAMPNWLIEQAIETARKAEISKINPDNLHVARGNALDFFSTYGINQERIEAKMGRKADEWTAENIADLKGMATGLKEGRVSPGELFPPVEEKAATPSNTTEPEENESQKFRSEWINLREAGYSTYVHQNAERFKATERAIQDEAKSKWEKLYGDRQEWPLGDSQPDSDNTGMIDCPNTEALRPIADCDDCQDKPTCPMWQG